MDGTMKYLIPLLFILTGCTPSTPAPDDGRGVTTWEFPGTDAVQHRRVTIEGRDYYIFRDNHGLFVMEAPKTSPEAKP